MNRMQLISRAGQLFLTGSPLWPKTVKLPRPKLKLEYLLHALNNILVGPHHLSDGHTIVISPSVTNCVHSSSITIFKTISIVSNRGCVTIYVHICRSNVAVKIYCHGLEHFYHLCPL